MRRRSHSVKHRSPIGQSSIVVDHHQRLAVDDIDDGTRHHRQQTRRCSTPNAVRRLSSSNNYLFTDHCSRGREPARTDVWPAAKMSPQKPDHPEDYTRVRQFDIDAKGALVSRGVSFRRNKENKRSGSNSPQGSDDNSCSSSISTAAQSAAADAQRPIYHICVLGEMGTGKSALISQFMTSEYRNPFSGDTEGEDGVENIVSVSIGGQANDLTFFEFDSSEDESWMRRDFAAYLLVFCIDSKGSFRHVLELIDSIRKGSRRTRHRPIIVAGNKVDLERTRTVSTDEASSAALTHAFAYFEISIALSVDVDELLVGILAEIQQSRAAANSSAMTRNDDAEVLTNAESPHKSSKAISSGDDSFQSAIRRFSQREGQTIPASANNFSTIFASLTPSGLIERFRSWRRRESK